MGLTSTALSYPKLFKMRFASRWTVAAALIFIVGLIVRLLLAYPVHKYRGDADGTVTGLCAMGVLNGNHPVFFPGGFRLGAQSCYVTAAAFSLFGVSRAALAVTGLIFSFFFMLFMYLYVKQATSPRACLAGLLLVAFPPLELIVNTYVPWAYGEILMYCASTLWLATLLDAQRYRRGLFVVFGASAGLALWCSAQSLMITGPVLIWMFFRGTLRSLLKTSLVFLGVLLGGLPVWMFLLGGGLSKMRGEGLLHTAIVCHKSARTPLICFRSNCLGYSPEPKLAGLRFQARA